MSKLKIIPNVGLCIQGYRQDWARSDFFKIVQFRSGTRAFSQIVPFSIVFFNRSVLFPFPPVLFRSEQKNGHSVPFRSWRSQQKNGSIPVVSFLVKNVSIPRSVLSKEQLMSGIFLFKKSLKERELLCGGGHYIFWCPPPLKHPFIINTLMEYMRNYK